MRRLLPLLLAAALLAGAAPTGDAAARPRHADPLPQRPAAWGAVGGDRREGRMDHRAAKARRSRDVAVRRGPTRRVLGRAWVLAQQPRLPPAAAPLLGVPAVLPAAPAAVPAAPVSAAPADPATVVVPADPPVVPSVGVTLRDTPAFTAQLSRIAVAAGSVRVQLANRGEDDHDLRLERADGAGPAYDLPLTQPNRTATATVDLDAGTWTLFCTLPGHRTAGMSATLTVSGG